MGSERRSSALPPSAMTIRTVYPLESDDGRPRPGTRPVVPASARPNARLPGRQTLRGPTGIAVHPSEVRNRRDDAERLLLLPGSAPAPGGRRRFSREEIGMSFGVHSEVGRLRKVLVHRTGLEHPRLTPPNAEDFPF